MKNVLITGGTGFIGRSLAKELSNSGYSVSLLTRGESRGGAIKSYHWDPENSHIDPEALKGVDIIIHLAGVNISGIRWTREGKREIVESRVKSADFLRERLKLEGTHPELFISASATGYYGAITTDKIFDESSEPSGDFLAETCVRWEESALRFKELGCRVVCIRTGIVLSSEGGALPKMALPVKYFAAAAPGPGTQYIPWIHIDDLTGIYKKAVADPEMEGAYNAVADEQVTMKSFYTTLSRSMNRKLYLPPVPPFILKLLLGEMALMLIEGSRVSNEKIRSAGYNFRYPVLDGALSSILKG